MSVVAMLLPTKKASNAVLYTRQSTESGNITTVTAVRISIPYYTLDVQLT
jgi:hypothetical protein